MPPTLSPPRPTPYRVRLSVGDRHYVYDSDRGSMQLASGIEIFVQPQQALRFIRATVRECRRKQLPYRYYVETIDHGHAHADPDDDKPCDS